MHEKNNPQKNTPLPATLNLVALRQKIDSYAKELGFSACRISSPALPEYAAHLQDWLDKGYHGKLHYMADHADLRLEPARLLAEIQSVICVSLPYLPQATPAEEVLTTPKNAYISRYALGRDYHRIVRRRLQHLATHIDTALREEALDIAWAYRVCSDSAPVAEVAFAAQAGIGWQGKHSLTLSRLGSWHFLGEIYTTLPLAADPPVRPHCGSCHRCLSDCPTQAIIAPYVVDARRCISYLTIELKESIPPALRPLIGNRIYGCDDCQLVCPWNRFSTLGDPQFAVRHGLDNAPLTTLFAWSADEFNQRLEGSPIRRIGHERWLRNIAVALGNSGDHTAIDVLQTRADHPSAMVREHVAWALEQLARTLPPSTKLALKRQHQNPSSD